ncbi:hypothetical protein HII36_26560 [Nonomuraea sp. NN258]|uniref:LptM family lipoprotein n=1 Tax=Nonomuraea antri TaxID=2730852 RepID=UPI00156A4272|nr:hypothetical protein [Nonomuraea antri]NRQ35363.1 hypothetical protein [Nonomuraea antri]
MKRALPAVLTVVAALLAAGCGQQEPAYTPRKAPQSTPASGSPTPATSQDPAVKTVWLGQRLRVRIERANTADPLLNLMTDYYLNVRKAVAVGDDRRYLDDLSLPVARDASSWVRAQIDGDKTLRGDARLYDLRINGPVDTGAQLEMCVDETRVRTVSKRTGKALPGPAHWRAGPYLQIVYAHRDQGGAWRIRSLAYDPKGCAR